MLGDSRLHIDDKTEFKVSWTFTSSDRKQNFNGFSIRNMFGIQGVDLLLLIAYGDTASFSVTVQNPGQDGTEASVKYYRCQLTPVANEKPNAWLPANDRSASLGP